MKQDFMEATDHDTHIATVASYVCIAIMICRFFIICNFMT